MAKPLATQIDQVLEQRLLDVLRRTFRYSDAQYAEIIHAFRENDTLKHTELAEIVDCSYPTAAKIGNLIRNEVESYAAKMEQARTSAVAQGLNPDAAVVTDLGVDDVLQIIDSRIRYLVATNGKDSDIQKWINEKVKLQNLTAESPTITVDPLKLLGPAGLEGTEDELLRRIRAIVRHRDLLPDFFASLRAIVETAIADDAAQPTEPRPTPDNLTTSSGKKVAAPPVTPSQEGVDDEDPAE